MPVGEIHYNPSTRTFHTEQTKRTPVSHADTEIACARLSASIVGTSTTISEPGTPPSRSLEQANTETKRYYITTSNTLGAVPQGLL